MEKLRPLAWLLIVMLALPISAGTDEEELQVENPIRPIGGLTFVDEYELTIANLVVYVTDKKGIAITDLTADDFEVFQDGEAKQITNFKLYTDEIIRTQLATQADDTFTLATPTPAPDDEAGPIPVHMVLYIDNQNLDPLDRNRVLSQTREFVRTSLHPPAQMMVVAYQRFFEVLQPFTSDPNKVMDALRVVRRYTGGRTENESTRRDIIDRIKSIENENRSGTGASSSGGSDLGGEWNEAYQLIDNYAREGVNDLKFTMDALRQIITSLSGLPGKKGIIYVSNGLPMVPGMDLFYELNRVTQSSSILTRMYEFDQTRAFSGLAATANAQDVAFYSIDAAGLTMGGMGSAEFASAQDPLSASVGRHNLTDSLRFLADETGGIAIINTNDVGPRLSLVTQDMFTYYSIGYPCKPAAGTRSTRSRSSSAMTRRSATTNCATARGWSRSPSKPRSRTRWSRVWSSRSKTTRCRWRSRPARHRLRARSGGCCRPTFRFRSARSPSSPRARTTSGGSCSSWPPATATANSRIWSARSTRSVSRRRTTKMPRDSVGGSTLAC